MFAICAGQKEHVSVFSDESWWGELPANRKVGSLPSFVSVFSDESWWGEPIFIHIFKRENISFSIL